MMKNFAYLLFAVILSVSCTREDADLRYETTFEVSPEIVFVAPAPPAPANSPQDIPAMQVVDRRDNRAFNLSLNQIEGFTFEEGFTYLLSVEVTTLASPPIDGAPNTYRLLAVVSKVSL